MRANNLIYAYLAVQSVAQLVAVDMRGYQHKPR